MISHFDQFTSPTELSPAEKAANDAILALADSVTEEWQAHVAHVFSAAILKANDGVMPTDEELSKWCRTLVLSDGTHLLTWKAPDWAPGETVDMKYVIARVGPPEKGGGQ